MRTDKSCSRRKLLKSTGAIAVVSGLAGCDGGDGGGTPTDGGNGDDTPTDGGNGTPTPTEVSFPERPIEMIIPYGTGGGFNYYTRLVSQYLEEEYLPVAVQPQNVTPDIAGHNQLYRADANGYTNGVVSVSSMSKAQVLQDEAEFDLREMTTYPRIAGSTEAVAVSTETDIQSVSEFVDAMSAGELNVYGESLTAGGVLDLVALGAVGGLFSEDRVLDNFVQFGGKSEGIAAMRRGEVHVMASAISSLLPYVESDDLRVLLTLTTGDPPESAPDGAVTLDDVDVEDPSSVTGFLGVEYDRVFTGPPDIPEARANVLREAFANAIQDSDLQSDAAENDRPINFAPSDEADQAIDDAVSAAQDNQDLLQRLFEGN